MLLYKNSTFYLHIGYACTCTTNPQNFPDLTSCMQNRFYQSTIVQMNPHFRIHDEHSNGL